MPTADQEQYITSKTFQAPPNSISNWQTQALTLANRHGWSEPTKPDEHVCCRLLLQCELVLREHDQCMCGSPLDMCHLEVFVYVCSNVCEADTENELQDPYYLVFLSTYF